MLTLAPSIPLSAVGTNTPVETAPNGLEQRIAVCQNLPNLTTILA
jgi:hypothetical protein